MKRVADVFGRRTLVHQREHPGDVFGIEPFYESIEQTWGWLSPTKRRSWTRANHRVRDAGLT